MKKLLATMLVAALAIVASSTVASADLLKSGGTLQMDGHTLGANMLDPGAGPHVGGANCVINFGGAGNGTSNESWDNSDSGAPPLVGGPGDVSNDVRLVDVAACIGLPSGSPVNVNGVGWNTIHQAIGASWLIEASIDFSNSGGPGAGFSLAVSGTYGTGGNQPQANTSGGVVKLANYAIPNLVLANGVLRLEFFESYDDVEDAVDATWNAGSALTIQTVETPEPASLALLGLAGLALIRRKR